MEGNFRRMQDEEGQKEKRQVFSDSVDQFREFPFAYVSGTGMDGMA